MSFTDPKFFIFFPIALAAVHLIPRSRRYLALLALSCIFYGWSDPKLLMVILAVAAWTFIGGLAISSSKQAHGDNGNTGYSGRGVFWFFFITNILILVFFKYGSRILGLLTGAAAGGTTAGGSGLSEIGIVMPIGLSFYIFQSTSYLSEIYRKGGKPEKNFLRYAAFVTFFPTVLSGPIQKSDCLLPQIKDPEEMDSNDYICGFLLFIWGIFLKTILSSRLAAAVTLVYGNVSEYSGMYCLAAAFIFSFYIYVDFSAYSDMAVGCARMLGFNIAPNFRGPFLSTSMSELWRRWHITLNSWFIENVYIPLGGSRHGRARKYLNVMIVFILSGAWHDATAGYLVWGALNGAIVVAEDAVRSTRKTGRQIKADAAKQADNVASRVMADVNDVRKKNFAIIWLRRLAVFCIFSFVFIFFRMPTIADANSLIAKIFTIRLNGIKDFMPTGLFSWNRNEMIITACVLLLFIVVQYLREIQTTKLVPKKWIENDGKGNSFFIKFRKVPVVLQVVVLAVLVTSCVFAYCGDTTQLNTAFLYYNF